MSRDGTAGVEHYFYYKRVRQRLQILTESIIHHLMIHMVDNDASASRPKLITFRVLEGLFHSHVLVQCPYTWDQLVELCDGLAVFCPSATLRGTQAEAGVMKYPLVEITIIGIFSMPVYHAIVSYSKALSSGGHRWHRWGSSRR